MLGVVLYGPPAAGKDTVTEALHSLDSRYSLFPRLKLGPGRTTGYRMTDAATIEALRARGDIIWQTHRYGALYVIDRPVLVQRMRDHVPILHIGQPEAIDAVRAATPGASWLIASLWCPRDIAEQRLRKRAPQDVTERLRAWDVTPPLTADGPVINTADHSSTETARLIHQHVAAIRSATHTSRPAAGQQPGLPVQTFLS